MNMNMICVGILCTPVYETRLVATEDIPVAIPAPFRTSPAANAHVATPNASENPTR